jgi:hypothetical protein
MESSTSNFTSKGQKNSRGPKGSRRPFSIENAGDQIIKRMTFVGNVLATGAGTVIPITSVTSSMVGTVPAIEWTSFSNRYQQYRVRAIRIQGKATNPVQSATIVHSDLFRGDYIGSAVPANATQVFGDERVKVNATAKDFHDVVTWKGNPNARLWNPTSAAIPVANQFSWVCASPTTPPLTTATTYYAYTIEWEVELRGSQ